MLRAAWKEAKLGFFPGGRRQVVAKTNEKGKIAVLITWLVQGLPAAVGGRITYLVLYEVFSRSGYSMCLAMPSSAICWEAIPCALSILVCAGIIAMERKLIWHDQGTGEEIYETHLTKR